jgi:hypothetical protein
MSGGAVSGNSSSYGGGGVYVGGGTFSMSGGAVSGNTLSGTNNYGREVVASGTFTMSGEARPERVFLYDNTRSITISSPLSGPVTPIDLGITSSAPLTGYINAPILTLDSSYSTGDMASLKTFFTLGNSKHTDSPYTEMAITGYEISDGGLFVRDGSPLTTVGGITYTEVSGGTWTLESDGRRKSPVIGNSTTTKLRVSFTSAAADARVTIQLDVSSEAGSDFAFIGALDNASAAYDSGYYERISGTATTTVMVTILVPTIGSHFVDIGYRKDGSTTGGSDCAWFKVVE